MTAEAGDKNSPLVVNLKSPSISSVTACEIFARSNSRAMNMTQANTMMRKSILRINLYSSFHVHRNSGSNRRRFSQSSRGWYAFAVSGLSYTEGWVAIADLSKFRLRYHQKRFSSWGAARDGFSVMAVAVGFSSSEEEEKRRFELVGTTVPASEAPWGMASAEAPAREKTIVGIGIGLRWYVGYRWVGGYGGPTDTQLDLVSNMSLILPTPFLLPRGAHR